MKLKDKVALITGGGRGIGKAVAMAYAREGAKLALCARTASELEQTVKEVQALKAECKGWSCDVSLEEPVRDFVASVMKAFGRIDVLVNNAGVMTRPAPIAELEVKKWDYTIAVNLRGPFLVTQAVLPFMMKQKSGSIINVSSSIGRSAYANFIAYATFEVGIGRVHANFGSGDTIARRSRQFRGTRLCCDQANRLPRQQAGIGDRRIRLSRFGRIQRHHRQNAQRV